MIQRILKKVNGKTYIVNIPVLDSFEPIIELFYRVTDGPENAIRITENGYMIILE
jgi:hypothetical protein